jgi:hypothetical protein
MGFCPAQTGGRLRVLWKLVGVVPVGAEEPAGNVAAQHQERAAGRADVSGGHVIATPCTGSSSRPVQSVHKIPRQVALRAKRAKLIKFIRR